MWRRGREVVRRLHGGNLKVSILLAERNASVTVESADVRTISMMEHSVSWSSKFPISSVARSAERFSFYIPREEFPPGKDSVESIVTGIERVLHGELAMFLVSETGASKRPKQRQPNAMLAQEAIPGSPWDKLPSDRSAVTVSLNGKQLMLEVTYLKRSPRSVVNRYGVRVTGDALLLEKLLASLNNSYTKSYRSQAGLMVWTSSKLSERNVLKALSNMMGAELVGAE